MRVPESARIHDHPILGSDADAGCNGAFQLLSCEPGWVLFVIAADGDGWEHVSVHAENARGRERTPTWREMCFVKDLFWEPEDCVMQLHPRRAVYVNTHPHTLHLWRPVLPLVIPEPPSDLVGHLDVAAARADIRAREVAAQAIVRTTHAIRSMLDEVS